MPLWVSTLEHNVGVVTDECRSCTITGDNTWKDRHQKVVTDRTVVTEEAIVYNELKNREGPVNT